jgi:hypothetical protein
VDDLRFLDFFFGLSPVPGVRKKKRIFLGNDDGSVTAGKATEVTNILETAEQDSIQVV